MKKQNILTKIAVIILTTIITLTSVNLVSNNNTAYAATTYNAETTTPASGNIFVSISGTFSSTTASQIVNEINKYRLEACRQGVINPESGKKLTMADYKPVVWSETLEAYARLRAVEASVNWAHTRPSNKSTFKNTVKLTKGYHSGENLAMGYDVLSSVRGYYTEKKAWVEKTGGQTGHYENMICPSHTLVGTAGFQQAGKKVFTAMEFGTILNGNANKNSTKQTGLKVKANQIVEVNVAYLVNSITLSGSNTVVAGNKIKLTATANMKNATKTATITKGLTWKSSNTNVATVDANGNVTAKKAGTVTITATAGGKSASYKVTVKAAVKATSIKLNKTSATLKVGKTLTLSSTVAPTNTTNKKVTYKSSNTKIATVDANGKVTAKAAGTVKITVTTADGSNKTATCTIKVTK